ncbi:hypothetical protein LPB90_18980 [Chryseobacterium sp. LC2016-29]|uniref:hypothetical protein n=1 Tax=Chryseobacterium sp. LC2016-29 TaxID=2897331 RepID=UPI001E426C03|nr:hypothetical protein [Chryseobacterium sp. LC2016-29]MCD0480530.1 hypothetical protein [Chryseobacterium sp. LC2016-29]
MNKIDFLSNWQKNLTVGLGEVILTEKTSKDEVTSMLIMSTNQFDNIINFHFENFRKLTETSLIYKYFDRDYIGENENWAVDVEMKIESVSEFVSHLEMIDENYELLDLVGKEYITTIEFCKKILNNDAQLYFKADNY